MSVPTFRRKVVFPSSGRQILFHTDAKVVGKKGFRPSDAAAVCSANAVSNTVCNNTLSEDRQRVHADGRMAVGILTYLTNYRVSVNTTNKFKFFIATCFGLTGPSSGLQRSAYEPWLLQSAYAPKHVATNLLCSLLYHVPCTISYIISNIRRASTWN